MCVCSSSFLVDAGGWWKKWKEGPMHASQQRALGFGEKKNVAIKTTQEQGEQK